MQGFVTYTPWRGDMNNVRLNFESVAAIAHLLDRQIAIPDDLLREGWAVSEPWKPLNPRHFLNPDYLPLTPLASVPRRASCFNVPAFQPDERVIAFEDDPALDAFRCGREVYWLPHQAAEIIKLPPLLTPFYALIFGNPTTRRKMVNHVRTCVRHYPEMADIARHIAGTLGEYHAVHVRRNDFLTHQPGGVVDINTIKTNVTEAVPLGSRLLIATDEPNRGFFDPLKLAFKIVFANDLTKASAPAAWSPTQQACVEQNLCAFADTFTATRLSTFSAYITRLRGYHGCGDVRVRFTDGTHHRIRDERGWPQFSWEPTFRSGQPLWGRDFREGWMS